MLEKIIGIDKQLLIFLNGLGSSNYDGFWLIITKQIYWTPFFILVFYFLIKKIGWQNFILSLFFIALLIFVSDQTSNFFKHYFQRLRPCNDLYLKTIIRIVKPSISYSFFSGHATSSMATTIFVYLLIRKYYKFGLLLFIFPLIFAFSRIYLGLHYPTDILTGYAFGATFGLLFYKIYQKVIFYKLQNSRNS